MVESFPDDIGEWKFVESGEGDDDEVWSVKIQDFVIVNVDVGCLKQPTFLSTNGFTFSKIVFLFNISREPPCSGV